MSARKRKATATSAAAFVLAGSAALAMPGTASADSLVAGSCGSSLKGEAGQPLSLDVGSVLGISGGPKIALGTVESGSNTFSVPGSQLLGAVGNIPIVGSAVPSVCKVTVTAANTAAAPVQNSAKAVTDTASSTVGKVGKALGGGSPDKQNPPKNGAPQQPGPGAGPNKPANPANPGSPGTRPAIPGSNSPVLGGTTPAFSGLPTSFSGGFSSMRDFSSVPASGAGLYAPAPGVRYGGQIPGYAPEFGVLGKDAPQPQPAPSMVRNAGQAEALPGAPGEGAGSVGVPMLVAVLALSGVSAALVRTWVLRKAVS